MSHDVLTEMLDLDVEVLHDFHRELITRVGALTGSTEPRIVDLGAGSGTGSIALARHLPGARITAVDVEPQMLEHLRRRAAERGVADRIDTVAADLDAPWPELGPADLVWASASLHHLADPAATVRQAYGVLRPGGLFAITELDSFPRFFTDPESSAIEERGQAVAARRRAEHGMHMDEDWGARLTAAGFTVEEHRRHDIVLKQPLPAATARYARVTFERLRGAFDDPADMAAIDRLVTGLGDRDDLKVRTTRTVWLARR